jgi:hypothetical protein
MSKTIGPSITILSANGADVAQANASWYNIEGPNQVMIDTQFSATANVHLDFDLHNNNSATTTSNINSNNQTTLDDPMGQIRAYCNNCGVGETVVVKIRKVYLN